jgi:hypothetical protein
MKNLTIYIKSTFYNTIQSLNMLNKIHIFIYNLIFFVQYIKFNDFDRF